MFLTTLSLHKNKCCQCYIQKVVVVELYCFLARSNMTETIWLEISMGVICLVNHDGTLAPAWEMSLFPLNICFCYDQIPTHCY